MSLAITQLCHEDLEDLGVIDDRLLDVNALNVYKALERKKVVVPSALRVPFHQTTVFHDRRITPAIGESLYGCGFLDVDGIDSSGITPLMNLAHPKKAQYFYFERTLKQASWLVSKGANLGRKTEQSLYLIPNPTAAHFLCFRIGAAADWDSDRRCFGIPPFKIRCSACEQSGRTKTSDDNYVAIRKFGRTSRRLSSTFRQIDLFKNLRRLYLCLLEPRLYTCNDAPTQYVDRISKIRAFSTQIRPAIPY